MFFRRAISAAVLVAALLPATAIEGPISLSWRMWQKANFSPTATPVVSDGTVYAPIGRKVYAVDAVTGSQRWAFPPGEELDGDFRASVVVAGNALICPNTNRFVYAVSKTDGSHVWSYLMTAGIARNVLTDGDSVYIFTSDNRIVGLDAKTGARIWAEDYDLGTNVVGEPAISGDWIVFYNSLGELTGFNKTTRKRGWTMRVQTTNADSAPFVFGNSVYVLSGTQVARINPQTGRTVGRILTLPLEVSGNPVITKKGGVAVTPDAKVLFFNMDRGTIDKKPLELGSYLRGGPSAAGDNVIVRTTNGGIYLIDPERKVVLWEYTTLPIPGAMRQQTTSTSGGSGSGGSGGGGGGGLTGGGQGGGTTTYVPMDYVSILGQVAVSGNSLFAIAEDGSIFAWGTDLGVDELGPRVTMMSPPEGSAISGKPDFDFVFRIEDSGTGVMSKSIQVMFGDQPMKFEYKPGGGYLYIKIRGEGSPVDGANPPLNDGKKVILVSVADWAGNISEKKFFITIDNSLKVIRERTVDDRTGGPGVGGGSGGGGGGIG